jgi:hypothetical protein
MWVALKAARIDDRRIWPAFYKLDVQLTLFNERSLIRSGAASGGPVRFKLKPIGVVAVPVVQMVMSGTCKLKRGFR